MFTLYLPLESFLPLKSDGDKSLCASDINWSTP
jgi:hypothetical protein